MYICHSCETSPVWPILWKISLCRCSAAIFFNFAVKQSKYSFHRAHSSPWVRDIAGLLQNPDEESNCHVKLADSQETMPNTAPSMCFKNRVILISTICFPGTSLTCPFQNILKFEKRYNNTIVLPQVMGRVTDFPRLMYINMIDDIYQYKHQLNIRSFHYYTHIFSQTQITFISYQRYKRFRKKKLLIESFVHMENPGQIRMLQEEPLC